MSLHVCAVIVVGCSGAFLLFAIYTLAGNHSVDNSKLISAAMHAGSIRARSRDLFSLFFSMLCNSYSFIISIDVSFVQFFPRCLTGQTKIYCAFCLNEPTVLPSIFH